MGLLDDAIREHLELKRRRGADANEVARQEQEAFGAARRGDLEAVAVADQAPALDEPAEVFAEVAEPEPVAEPAPTQLHVVEPEVRDEPPRPHGDPADALPHAEPEPVSLEPEPAEPEHLDQPTRAFDAEEVRAATTPPPAEVAPAPVAEPEPEREPEPEPAPAAARPEDTGEPEPAEEDVLEETPEFLQETPEHDRLWFEQRPPRDFDF